MVVPTSGTRIKDLRAMAAPLRMASGTSFALPMPAPTCPWPSPTTTMALKLKRRPPLTTFDTRLISTTRSVSSRWVGSIFSIRVVATDTVLELQSSLASGLRQGPYAPVVPVPSAVKDHLLDPLLAGPLADQGAHHGRRLRLGASLARTHRLLQVRGGHQRLACLVVDDLGVDVREAAEDAEPGAPRGALHLLAHPQVAPLPRRCRCPSTLHLLATLGRLAGLAGLATH